MTKKTKITKLSWGSAHDLADMAVDGACKQALALFILSKLVSEVKMGDLIYEAQEKVKPKFDKAIDEMFDLLQKKYGVDFDEN